MPTKPDIHDTKIIKCLEDAYALCVESVTYLPLGADFQTTVYRVTTSQGPSYFLKVRSGPFLEASVTVPKHLWDLGARHVISPLPTKNGNLWVTLGSAKAILYPYIEGCTGADTPLSKEQWSAFGAAVKKLHLTRFPKNITKDTPKEQFSSTSGGTLKDLLTYIESGTFEKPVAAKTAMFLQSKSAELLDVIRKTEDLAQRLKNSPFNYVLCHADLHGWNLMIDQCGALYVVDWDTLIFAPKERDLMFIGAGIWDSILTWTEEETLFYEGYGQVFLDQEALCYYRFERILNDIKEYCDHIFVSGDTDDAALSQSFDYLASNFRPAGTLARAYASWTS
ncbi:MAG: phosphotransferase [Alphaproteobacteria bacterium]|nr:phosphotransferase [Alphaproteobacteria bacterium]